MKGEARQVGSLTPDSRGFWSLRRTVDMATSCLYVLLGKTRKDILLEERRQRKGTFSAAIESTGMACPAGSQLDFRALGCASGPDYGERMNITTFL